MAWCLVKHRDNFTFKHQLSELLIVMALQSLALIRGTQVRGIVKFCFRLLYGGAREGRGGEGRRADSGGGTKHSELM
jgi:hypothetical protein